MICAVYALREYPVDDDWLGLYFPLAALGWGDARVGAYPFGRDTSASLAWRRPIDDWLAALAGEVRRAVGFRCAGIGVEVTEDVDAYKPEDEAASRSYALVLADGTYLPAAY